MCQIILECHITHSRLTTADVGKVYKDVFISVGPALLVVEAKRMQELMDNGTVTSDTASGKAHLLLSSDHTNVGGTTVNVQIKIHDHTTVG